MNSIFQSGNQVVQCIRCARGHDYRGGQNTLPDPGLPGSWKTVDAKKEQIRFVIPPRLSLNCTPSAHCKNVVLRLHYVDPLLTCRGKPQPGLGRTKPSLLCPIRAL